MLDERLQDLVVLRWPRLRGVLKEAESVLLDDRGEGHRMLEEDADLRSARAKVIGAHMFETLRRLQVLSLTPMPLAETGEDLERITACLIDDPVGVTVALTVGPDLEHFTDGGDEGLLQTLHDLRPGGKLDGAPLLDQGIDGPEGVEQDCGGGGA